MLRGTGIFATCSAVRMVVDSTEDTSIGLTAPVPITVGGTKNPDVDAIVQCGTNLSMVRLADEAERWLGKPVIAINAATWWMALRENGIKDKVYGAGSLLREY